MATEITDRDLGDDCDDVLRRVDQGESFVVTRNGVPVGDLTPVRSRRFVSADGALAVFAGAPSVEGVRLRDDLDGPVDQDPAPRT